MSKKLFFFVCFAILFSFSVTAGTQDFTTPEDTLLQFIIASEAGNVDDIGNCLTEDYKKKFFSNFGNKDKIDLSYRIKEWVSRTTFSLERKFTEEKNSARFIVAAKIFASKEKTGLPVKTDRGMFEFNLENGVWKISKTFF